MRDNAVSVANVGRDGSGMHLDEETEKLLDEAATAAFRLHQDL